VSQGSDEGGEETMRSLKLAGRPHRLVRAHKLHATGRIKSTHLGGTWNMLYADRTPKNHLMMGPPCVANV